jgi:hypothetical protein
VDVDGQQRDLAPPRRTIGGCRVTSGTVVVGIGDRAF